MSVRFSISVSLDGFLAGPNRSPEAPLGVGAEALHAWVTKLAAWREPHGLDGGEVDESTPVVEAAQANAGAYLMGREMFGGGPGEWGGWWGDDPPFKAPVVILTHYPREPMSFENGTSFEFVDGFEPAFARARELAGDRDVVVAGGADVVQQCLRARVVDEFTVSIAPLLLGGGTRLLDGLPHLELELVEVVGAPDVAHLRYRVKR